MRVVALATALAVVAPAASGAPGDADTVSPELLRLKERQERVEALSELFQRQSRVYRLGYPLLYAALDMCPERVRAAAGFTYANAYMFSGPVRSAASAIGYSHRVSVVDVVANSAAAAAGIRPRDVLLAINDWPAPFGEGAVTLTAAKLRDTLERAGRATLTLRRGGAELRATVQPDYICDLRVLAAPGETIAAYGDGQRVVVFHPLMDFADDGELAAVIAREIANSLIPGLDLEGVPGDFALSNFFNWGMEAERPSGDPAVDQARARDWGVLADYLGAYLLARAGFDHRKGLAFRRRLAASGTGGSYPPHEDDDLLRLEAAAREIDAKLAARQRLLPAGSVPEAVAEAEVEGLPWHAAPAPPPEPVPAAAAPPPPVPTAAAVEPPDYRVDVAPLAEPRAEPAPEDEAPRTAAPPPAPAPARPPPPAAAEPAEGFSFSAWFAGE